MRKWYPVAILVIAVIGSIVGYTRMPDVVPIHFNAKGEADGWGNRLMAVALMPGMMLLLWGMLEWLPRIDPKRANYAKFQGAYDIVINATLTLLLAMHFMIIGSALGMPVLSFKRIMPIAVGAMFLVVGNVLPRTRRNWFFGLRTPWTLSSDRVWERSNRFAGYALMIAGLLIVVAAFLPEPFGMIALMVFGSIAALSSVVYSYFVWKDEGGDKAVEGRTAA
jgi:uncharacterized membrane protein